jgi:hypothetical protein
MDAKTPVAIAADISRGLEAEADAVAARGDYDAALQKLRAALAVWKLAERDPE